MKLKLWLLGLTLSTATAISAGTTSTHETPAHHAGKSEKVESSQHSLAVNPDQAKALQNIADALTETSNSQGSVSGPEELFKIINGEMQTTTRELPLQSTVTEAVAKGYRITCYQEGSETVVASTDPALLGKPISDLKIEGESVRDRAIAEIRKNGKDDKAMFTYTQSDGSIVVDGKPVGQRHIVAVAGRKAFKNFNSQKKFLCAVAAVAE